MADAVSDTEADCLYKPLVDPVSHELTADFVTVCQIVAEKEENVDKDDAPPSSASDIEGYNKWCQKYMLRPSNMDHEHLFSLSNKSYHEELMPYLTKLQLFNAIVPSMKDFDYYVILGGTAMKVNERINYLLSMIFENGSENNNKLNLDFNKRILYACGEREFFESEYNDMISLGFDIENMVKTDYNSEDKAGTFIFKKNIENNKFTKDNKELQEKLLSKWTVVAAKKKENGKRPNTQDTMKICFDLCYDNACDEKIISMLFVSNPPFGPYQNEVIQTFCQSYNKDLIDSKNDGNKIEFKCETISDSNKLERNTIEYLDTLSRRLYVLTQSLKQSKNNARQEQKENENKEKESGINIGATTTTAGAATTTIDPNKVETRAKSDTIQDAIISKMTSNLEVKEKTCLDYIKEFLLYCWDAFEFISDAFDKVTDIVSLLLLFSVGNFNGALSVFITLFLAFRNIIICRLIHQFSSTNNFQWFWKTKGLFWIGWENEIYFKNLPFLYIPGGIIVRAIRRQPALIQVYPTWSSRIGYGIILELLGILLVFLVPIFSLIEGLYLLIFDKFLKRELDEGPGIVFGLFATLTESIPEAIVQTVVFIISLGTEPTPSVFALSMLFSLVSIFKSLYHFITNMDILHGLTMAPEHSNSVTAITFSPNGLNVVSGSKDKTIRFWAIDDNNDEKQVSLVPLCKVEAGIMVFGLKFINKYALLGCGEKKVKKWDLRDIFETGDKNDDSHSKKNGETIIDNYHFIRAFDYINLKCENNEVKHWVAINGYNDVRKGCELLVFDISNAMNNIYNKNNTFDCPLLLKVKFEEYGLLMDLKFFNVNKMISNEAKLAVTMRGNLYFRPDEDASLTQQLSYDYVNQVNLHGTCQTPMLIFNIESNIEALNEQDSKGDNENNANSKYFSMNKIDGYSRQGIAIPYKLLGASARFLGGQEDGMWQSCWILNNNEIISAQMDGTLRRWDCDKSKLNNDDVLVGHSAWVNAVDSVDTKDGCIIVSGGQDGDIRVWTINEKNKEKHKLISHFAQVHPITIKCIAISSDAKYVASGADDKKVQIRKIGQMDLQSATKSSFVD